VNGGNGLPGSCGEVLGAPELLVFKLRFKPKDPATPLRQTPTPEVVQGKVFSE